MKFEMGGCKVEVADLCEYNMGGEFGAWCLVVVTSPESEIELKLSPMETAVLAKALKVWAQ